MFLLGERSKLTWPTLPFCYFLFVHIQVIGFMYYISTTSAAGRVGPQNRAPRYAENSPIGLKMGSEILQLER